jgi:hypothetical protein
MVERSSLQTLGMALLFLTTLLPGVTAASGGSLRPKRSTADAPTQVSIAIPIGPLYAAIEDLTATFADRYPHSRDYLHELDALKRQVSSAGSEDNSRLQARFAALQRTALTANPLVCEQPLLFVVRKQYQPDHHNTETMFQTGEINTAKFAGGAALKLIDLATGQLRVILATSEGVIRDPDVRFDGKKILFSMRRDRADDYHLYEIDADGTALRQVTFGSGLSDIDPIYLPDGRFCFTSTREPKYCMCNRHIMGNLHTMNADGSNIEQIGHNTLHEGHASLLPDGRILYDRWEYVDRNFGDAQGVWTVNPDGTSPALYWKNNTNSPGAVLDARAINGSEQFISVFSSCHDRPWGALAIVDRRLGLDGREPVVRTWPASAIELVGQGNYDTFKRVQLKYEDPYPLSEKYFLCSRMIDEGEGMGIYLVDTFGNEILLHAESPACFDPMPLAPRVVPPVIPSRIDRTKEEGYFYISDVYRGTGMEQVPRGSVKRLRVVESPEKRFWTTPAWNGGTGTQAPGMAWNDFNNKRILGSVPVAADGSAYFAVPADRFIYFQLLDAEGRMVQSMRSGTIVRPGETSGCAGCHEDRRSSTLGDNFPESFARGPSRLEPWYGPPRLFSYTAEVQPVFDKHCTCCHDYGQKAGEKLNLSGDLGLLFNTSYVELRSKNLVHVVDAGPFQVQMPKSWGSHVSRLAKYVLQGHDDREIDREVRLDPETIDRVLTWIDINAPYYPDYAGGAFRDQPYGRSPVSQAELKRLGELTSTKLFDRKQIGLVNFTRPERSPCLARLSDQDDPRYHEALAIIRSGQQRLAVERRPDMPGFRLSAPIEIEQEKKYQAWLADEARVRAAIATGQKQFPDDKRD